MVGPDRVGHAAERLSSLPLHHPAAPACWLDATTAVSAYGSWAIVDVRSPLTLARSRIPGSLQIAAHAVKRKPFLRDRSVLLVGDGPADRQLLATCEELREEGFGDVRILNGGLHAWKRAGGKLDGALAERIPRIRAAKVAEAFDPKWCMVFLVDGDASNRLATYNPATIASGSLDEETLEKLIERSTPEGARKAGIEPTVIVAASSAEYRRLDHVLAASQRNVFFVDGGIPALAEQTRVQQVMLRKPDHVLQRPRSCQ